MYSDGNVTHGVFESELAPASAAAGNSGCNGPVPPPSADGLTQRTSRPRVAVWFD